MQRHGVSKGHTDATVKIDEAGSVGHEPAGTTDRPTADNTTCYTGLVVNLRFGKFSIPALANSGSHITLLSEQMAKWIGLPMSNVQK